MVLTRTDPIRRFADQRKGVAGSVAILVDRSEGQPMVLMIMQDRDLGPDTSACIALDPKAARAMGHQMMALAGRLSV